MSEVVGEVWVAVRPEVGGFGPALSRDVQVAGSAAGAAAGRDAGQSFSRSFSAAVKSGAAIVGVVGAFDEVRRSIEAAAAHSGEIALLTRAIDNAGAANTVYGQTVEDAIRQQALQRGFIDEQLYPSFTRLVGATHSTEKAYKDLGLAEDIARQRHIDVTVAALALAKAEQGSATGLQRLGVILPEYAAHLDRAAKSAIVLDIAQKRFGGSAEAFAQSGAGALQRFTEARHLIEEAAGAVLLPQVEHAAAATADWASKSQNLERVQHDVADVAHVVEGAVKGAATAFEIVDKAVGPVVGLLGGFDKAAELAFGLVALRKVQALTAATGLWGRTVVTTEAAAAAATTGYTAAVTLNTGAQVANVVAVDTATAAFGLNAAAATRGGVILGETGTAAAGARAGFLSLGLSGTGLAGVLKSGVGPAAGLAGYELSTFIRKIPGWDSAMRGLGATAESLAESLGLIGKADVHVPGGNSGFDASVQTKLADAYKQALKIDAGSFTKEARDRLVAQLVGPGYTFNDAQVFANAASRRDAAFTSADARRAGGGAAGAAGGRPTDLDYQIALQAALATKTTNDEKQLYEDRKRYIDKRITALQADNSLTDTEKKTLARLETERNSLQSAIDGIDKQAVQDAKAAADKARQAYSDAVGVREQGLQLQAQRAQLTAGSAADDLKAARDQLVFYRAEAADMKLTAQQRAQYASQVVGAEQAIISINQQIHAKEAQAYRDSLSLTEQRLQLAAQRAQLTEKSVADDKAAARKLIAFYTKESHDGHLTEAERLQFASQAIQERITQRGFSRQGQGATAQQIFSEAASEFRTFGSNIAARGGPLSGQDERALFAGHLIHSTNTIDLTARVAQLQRSTQIVEAQRQTALLESIDRKLGPGGSENRPVPVGINDARRFAGIRR